MQKQVLTIVLIVVGVLLAVDVLNKKANDPVMREMMNTQSQLLQSQKSIEEHLKNAQPSMGADLSELKRKQENMDKRLTALETQLKGFLTALSQAQAGPPPEEYTKVYTINVDNSPVKGKKDAPITIVEFADLQCPFCAKFHPVLNEVIAAYPDQVNYIVKNFPLAMHPNARPAAKAALAAEEQGKYFEMVDLLLTNSRNLGDEKYKELAKELGLNGEKFMKDYKEKDAKWEDIIEKDLKLGEEVAVRGTPTYYINGRKTQARDLASFKREIDRILSGKK